MTGDLFADADDPTPWPERLGEGAVLLHGRALAAASVLCSGVQAVTARAPLRNMQTPGGYRMSVAMSNCGPLGWVTDRGGYRYASHDPDTGLPWPDMPTGFAEFAGSAAQAAGFDGFIPDACLINRYAPGSRMALHQDKDEQDFSAPIVSVSLGIPAIFLWGGLQRSERPARILLEHGDVFVWGGPDRLRFHGVLPLKPGSHPLCGNARINLTFRCAG